MTRRILVGDNLARSRRMLVGALLTLYPFAGDAFGQSYRLVELQPLTAQTTTVAQDINNQLQIVGLSGGQLCVWNVAGEVQSLAIAATGAVVINNHGMIAGTRLVAGRPEPFLWADGVVTRPPMPPGEFIGVRRLTDNNILLMSASTGSWAAVGDTLYDLTALTGATIHAVNEAGTIGGGVTGPFFQTDGYLRYLDGRTLTAPAAVVQVIGSAGHFGGSIGTRTGYGHFFGRPDGTVTIIEHFGRFPGAVNDVNRHGVFVGYLPRVLFGLGPTAFVYADGRGSSLAVGGADVNVQSAHAITDSGHILASARIAGAPAATVLLVPVGPPPPSGLSFTVSDGIVTLTWEESPGAIEYVLEAGSVPGATNLFNAPIGSAPRLSTPAPPGRYYVRLRARNAHGVSVPSAEVVVDVP